MASAKEGNNMKVLTYVFAGAVCVMAAGNLTAPAFADSGWEFTEPGNSFTNGQWDFATAFTVNRDVTLSGLGYYADPITGNADGNAVAFYQCADTACLTTGTLLASTTVTNVFPLNGHFRYVTINPINLVAGVSYEVAGVSNVDNYTWADPGFAVNSAISILDTSGQEPRWQTISTPDFLTGSPSLDQPGNDGYWGPNVFLGKPSFATPEPATWAMMVMGFLGLGFAGYRRARKRQFVAQA
jgi:PEP-CTERM motif